MKNFSIRKILNLFNRKDNNYNSNIEYTDIDYDICVVTTPNLINKGELSCHLPIEEFLNTIIIRYTFNRKSILNDEFKDGYNQFKEYLKLYKITYLNWFTDKLDCILFVSLSSFEASKIIDINGNKENRFIDILREVTQLYDENIEHYDFEDVSFEMVENTHKNFRKDFYQYSNVNIDILGYTWLDKPFRSDGIDSLSISQFNYIYIIINLNLVNEFSAVEKFHYEEDNKAILKMRIIDFIYLINDQDYSTLSIDTINAIRKIIKSNESYFQYLYELIDTDYIVKERNDDTDRNNEDIDTEKFIEMVDEIIKNS